MQDVEPLKNRGSGRQIVPKKQEPPSSSKPQGRDAESRQYLHDLIEGKVEFEIEFTSEFVQGNVKGLDPRIFRQLKSGHYSPQGHLDLHGFTAEIAWQQLIEFVQGNVKGLDPRIFRQLKSGHYSPQGHLDLHGFTAEIAWQQLIEFVKTSYLSGKRCLLLIPGRGRNSPQGRGVLREQLQQWLTRDPLKRVVLAFSTAQPEHGGAGALYILLRKYKKSRGKIFWERFQNLADL
jgi:DNA-nicking Smr family endonuclease